MGIQQSVAYQAVKETDISDEVMKAATSALWMIVKNNLNFTISLKFWFISKKFTLRDLLPVVELILGPEPDSPFSINTSTL